MSGDAARTSACATITSRARFERALQPQFFGARLHGLQAEFDVLVERYAQFLGALR